LVAVETPSRASKAELTVDSRADRDIGVSSGNGVFREKLTGFFGIRAGRVKVNSPAVPAKVS
jgi:hypothetical protein